MKNRQIWSHCFRLLQEVVRAHACAKVRHGHAHRSRSRPAPVARPPLSSFLVLQNSSYAKRQSTKNGFLSRFPFFWLYNSLFASTFVFLCLMHSSSLCTTFTWVLMFNICFHTVYVSFTFSAYSKAFLLSKYSRQWYQSTLVCCVKLFTSSTLSPSLSLSLFSLYLSISLCVSVHPSPLHLSIFKLHLILSVAAAGAVAVFPFIALKCLSNLFKRKLKAVVSLSLHLSLSLRGFFCPFS